MPEVSAETFALACMSVVAGASDYVPPLGKGSLYLRPLLLGTGPILGLGPAPSFTFTVFGAAVGTYFRVRRLPLRPCLHAVHDQLQGSACVEPSVMLAGDVTMQRVLGIACCGTYGVQSNLAVLQ